MMLPMVNMAKINNAEELSLPKEVSSGESDSFINALATLLQGEETDEDILNSLSLGFAEEEDFIAELMQVDAEEILEVIYELLDEIPMEEGFIPEEILTEEVVISLLDVLPESWKEDLEELMDNYVSLEGLLEEFETSGDPVILLALITSFTVKEQQGFDLKEGKGFQALQQLVASYFPQVVQNNEKTSNLKQIFHQLKEFFGEAEKSQAKATPLLGQAKLDSQPSTLATRIAELAHLNQLASSASKPVVRDNQSPAMVLDASNSHMARLQQFMVHTGEAQAERPKQEQFIRQFQQLLAKSSFQQLSNGIQQLNVKLNPATLGRLDITIQQVNGVLVAKMMTTTAVARDLMEGQLQHLRSAFQSQNIQVDKIEVTQQQSQQLLKDPLNDDPKKEHTPQRQSGKEEESEEEEVLDFAEFLEATINTEV